MRRLVLFALYAGPLFVVLLVSPGCKKGDPAVDDAALAERRRKNAEKVKVARTPLKAQGQDGIVRGRVVFDGTPPEPQAVQELKLHPDKDACLKGGLEALYKENWVVNKDNKGVANVFVYVDPPAGSYYNLTKAQTNRQGEVLALDQPHCSFVPHALGLFPAYYDGSKHVPTGQVLEFRNSDPVVHSIQIDQSPPENDAVTQKLAPGNSKQVTLNPQKRPLLVGCGDHKWMMAVVWPFEHPYFAITKADGSFEIKDLPTGVELTVKAWHEWRRAVFAEKAVTLAKGDNPTLEFKVSK